MYRFFSETYNILNESSFYILIGFFFAGLIHYLIPQKSIAKHLGKDRLKNVVKASLLGIPLPLCSCSVIPTAFNLRRSGAKKSSVVSFLISTPETGIDSLFITYALMGPVIMIARPVAAFFTAVFAGVMEMFFGDDNGTNAESPSEECADGCCGGGEKNGRSLVKSLSYAFNDLFKDIYLMLLLGIVIAGAIASIVPKEMFSQYLHSELLSMLTMLLISVPVYVCATASTPIAAALMLKGISPGAAVVFLLAGPATNIMTLTVLTKKFGRKTTVIYLLSIIGCSLFFGYAINLVHQHYMPDVRSAIFTGKELVPDTIKYLSSYALIALSAYIFIRSRLKPDKTCG